VCEDHQPLNDSGASRRNFLRGLGVLTGGLVAAGCANNTPVAQSSSTTAAAPAAMAAQAQTAAAPKGATEIAAALADGNKRWVAGQSVHPHLEKDVRAKQAEKQTPFAAVLGCADSRVSPELVFDQGVGDLFVVRVAGNIASADAVASLAYAVEHLGVTFITVLGHESCGAVKATLDTITAGGEVPHEFAALIDPISPAVRTALAAEKDPAKQLQAAVETNAKLVASQLPGASEILHEGIESGKVTIQVASYSVKTSAVTVLPMSA
jgi:carbonic anhydrase